MLLVSTKFFFSILWIGNVFSNRHLVIPYSRDKEYISFLEATNRAEESVKAILFNTPSTDKNRESEYFYAGYPEDDASRYLRDRHGSHYIKCAEYNSSSGEEPSSGRCHLKTPGGRSACHMTMDYTHDNLIMGCFDDFIDNGVCNNDCAITVKHYGGEVVPRVLAGFCCCLTHHCNENAEEMMADALKKYQKEQQQHHHHHHQHHQQKETLSFWDRFRNAYL